MLLFGLPFVIGSGGCDQVDPVLLATLHKLLSLRVVGIGQMDLVAHPPGGQFAPIGDICIVRGTDHFRRGRNVVIGTEVGFAIDQLKLLHPHAPQDLDCWDML